MYRFDLHVHSCASYDGYMTLSEIDRYLKDLSIDFYAVTDHDVIAPDLTASESRIIGCEFTSDRGTHIIGLFITESLPVGGSAFEIFDHIRRQNGLILIPHPFKADSGYVANNEDLELLHKADFIELVNGGLKNSDDLQSIRCLAAEYSLVMFASSDSHKPSHLGKVFTVINPDYDFDGLYQLLAQCKQQHVIFGLDQSFLNAKDTRKVGIFRRSRIYQKILSYIPWGLRVSLKKRLFLFAPERRNKFASEIVFFSCEDFKW